MVHADEQETRRLKNRECMRKIRQRQRRELQEMTNTARRLETQYRELCHRASSDQAAGSGIHSPNRDQERDFVEVVELSKRLGAEKLYLQTLIKQKKAWQRRLQRILDFEGSSNPPSQQMQTVVLDQLDEAHALEELGFHPVTDWDLTQSIMDNKRNMERVQSQLLTPSMLDMLSETRTHRLQAFGWDVVQHVNGGAMECVLTKMFTGLDIFDLMQRSFVSGLQFHDYRRSKAETRRLQVLQQLNPNAYVLVRDVASPTDVSTFRTVFVHFLMETSKEFSSSDASQETLLGSGYVLGGQSVATDRSCLARDDKEPKLAWAGMSVSIEALDIVNSTTGERSQRIRWTASNDYGTEAHAQRNAADTLQAVLRWEMFGISPTALVSVSPQ